MASLTRRFLSPKSEPGKRFSVASCNGDMRGAMKALLLVNEQLESELNHLYEAAASGLPTERAAKKSLH